MIPRKELEKILEGTGGLYDKVNEILKDDVRIRALELLKLEREREERAVNMAYALLESCKVSKDFQDKVPFFEQSVKDCKNRLKELEDEDSQIEHFIKRVKENKWSLYVSLPFLLKKHKDPDLRSVLQKFFKREKTIFVVHPGWSETTDEALRKDTELHGSYKKYLQNLKEYLAKQSSTALIVYFVCIDTLEDFQKRFKPKQSDVFLIIPTQKSSPATDTETLLADNISLISFLQDLTSNIEIAGEWLWAGSRSITNLSEIAQILKDKGHDDAAKNLQAYINLKESKREEGVCSLMQSFEVSEDVVPFFKYKTNYGSGCVFQLKKEMNQYFTTKLIRTCCYPLKDPPGGLAKLSE